MKYLHAIAVTLAIPALLFTSALSGQTINMIEVYQDALKDDPASDFRGAGLAIVYIVAASTLGMIFTCVITILYFCK